MSKKVVHSLVAGCLATGLLLNPLTAYAEVEAIKMPAPAPAPVKVKGDAAQAKVPLDQAIATAKSLFAISGDFDRFESGFNTDAAGRTEWSLNWNRTKEPNANVSVRVNASTGEVIGMDRWESPPPGQKYSGLPRYSYQDGAKLAQEWLQKLAPRYAGQTQLKPNQEQLYYGYGERGSVEHDYSFSRMVNGIPYADNNIYIRINGDTGQLVGFNLNWDENLTFPGAGQKISLDQAQKIFGQQVELVYFRARVYGVKDAPVKLVYQVKNGRDMAIDALTGKVLENDGYYRAFDAEMMAKAAGRNGSAPADNLSPIEQAEVDKIANLLTREKALELAKRAVTIPGGLKEEESRLSQDYQFPEVKLWNFNWSGGESSPISMNVNVNAVTGELISFSKWDNARYEKLLDSQPSITLEQARQTAEAFIKKQQPQRWTEVKLVQSRADDVIPLKGKILPRAYNFYYSRLVNGLSFPSNGFNIQVDPYTGEITSYQMNWWKLNFPSPDNVLSPEKAVQALLANGGLSLEYQRLTVAGKEAQMYLVYRLKDSFSYAYMVDAGTGTSLGWDGEPLPPQQTSEFSDIAGHPAEDAIKALAQANIARSVDGKFYPDRNITKLEALELLVASRGDYVDSPYELLQSDKEKEERRKKIINAAVRQGIIQPGETGNLDQELTRLEFAVLLINTLDYDGAAKLKDIYVLKSKDADAIPEEQRGYVALSLGLGLQTESGDMFKPGDKIPRGYAATSIVRMLNVQK
ncbi:YcdB/YcdC domain-containing protein [Desulforamulus ruminis]|uniref:YcdB/YcdC domain-containing protein n=1 Tax=Desulforamulus ruminis TaxID=1564 RepID=UPI002FD8B32A